VTIHRLAWVPLLLAGCTNQLWPGAKIEQPVAFYRADCESIDNSLEMASLLKSDVGYCAEQAAAASLREPASSDVNAKARALDTARFACMVQRGYFAESASRNWSRCTMKKMGV